MNSPPKIVCFGDSLSNQSSFNARGCQMCVHFSKCYLITFCCHLAFFFWRVTCWPESIFAVPQTFAQTHKMNQQRHFYTLFLRSYQISDHFAEFLPIIKIRWDRRHECETTIHFLTSLYYYLYAAAFVHWQQWVW